jgi:predicted component of type VI protein secretion system
MFNSQVQKYRVTDFSSNGTYVNGSRLPANSPVLLTRGTELALGDNNNIIRLS